MILTLIYLKPANVHIFLKSYYFILNILLKRHNPKIKDTTFNSLQKARVLLKESNEKQNH